MGAFKKELKELCEQLFNVGAVKFGNFKMKVGINSPIYFDLRVMVSYPPLMEKLSTLVWQLAEAESLKPAVICGVPYTALPISTIVSIKSNIPMLIRRKEQKKYGTMKLIEGNYNSGDECLIIEDVVTSGCSVLETAKDLRHDGLLVKDVVVILDREQGGQSNLTNNNIRMHSLLNLSQILDILEGLGKIDQATTEQVRAYIRDNQILPHGTPLPKNLPGERLRMAYEERAKFADCPLSRRLLELMSRKRTNLCVAVDVPTSELLLSIVFKVGGSVAVVKTHCDAVKDWSSETEQRLCHLARTLDFIILEDRKLCDIGHIVGLQTGRVAGWADCITSHSLSGPGSLSSSQLPVFLVAQLSCEGSLITDQYTAATCEMANSYKSSVVGMVCQDNSVVTAPGMLQLTPGVSSAPGGDGKGQNYVTPEDAVLVKGGDLIVVGRAIINSSTPEVTAKEFQDKLWAAYEKRLAQVKTA